MCKKTLIGRTFTELTDVPYYKIYNSQGFTNRDEFPSSVDPQIEMDYIIQHSIESMNQLNCLLDLYVSLKLKQMIKNYNYRSLFITRIVLSYRKERLLLREFYRLRITNVCNRIIINQLRNSKLSAVLVWLVWLVWQKSDLVKILKEYRQVFAKLPW